MIALIATSLIWAFSFGLIGHVLQGVDPYFLAFARLLLAWVCFLPLSRIRSLSARALAAALGIGAVQYGVMYVALFQAYRYLRSHEVALFTIFTPLWVVAFHDVWIRRAHARYALAAVTAVIGAGVLKWDVLQSTAFWKGFAWMQLSNACFAFGQVAYRQWRYSAAAAYRDVEVFSWLYLGAAIVSGVSWGLWRSWSWPELSATQAGVVIYLGVVASGLAFFLWNWGAVRVNAGVLAVFNNLKIPLAVAVSLVVFREPVSLIRLLAGGGLCVLALQIAGAQTGTEV